MNQAMAVLTSQATVEWYTPPHIIDRARVARFENAFSDLGRVVYP